MKPKTGFEGGNSPPKVSENGARIQTGRGLEETKRRIIEAFESIRQHLPAPPPLPPAQHQEPTPQVELYTEQHEERFHKRAKKLASRALTSSHIATTRDKRVWEIEPPNQTADELFREALWLQNRK